MDNALLIAIAGGFGAAMAKLFDFLLSKRKVEAEVTIQQGDLELKERQALNKEWEDIRDELKGSNAYLRTEVERLGAEMRKTVEQLEMEHHARISAEERLEKVERAMLEAVAGRDFLERKLRKLEMYIDLLLDVMRRHGIPHPRMDEDENGA